MKGKRDETPAISPQVQKLLDDATAEADQNARARLMRALGPVPGSAGEISANKPSLLRKSIDRLRGRRS